jgi:hypothetical protein
VIWEFDISSNFFPISAPNIKQQKLMKAGVLASPLANRFQPYDHPAIQFQAIN